MLYWAKGQEILIAGAYLEKSIGSVRCTYYVSLISKLNIYQIRRDVSSIDTISKALIFDQEVTKIMRQIRWSVWLGQVRHHESKAP